MSASPLPKWVVCARNFVATDKLAFLYDAMDACDDPEVRNCLNPQVVVYGELDANEAAPILRRLMAHGREPEAIILIILALRKPAFALWDHDSLDPEREEVARASCFKIISMSHDSGFVECEARLTLTLGVYYASRGERAKGAQLVRDSLNLYRVLSQAEPDPYRHSVASALNILGSILLHEGDLQSGRATFEEAAGIQRDLARTNPEVHRRFHAATLRNFSVLLGKAGGKSRTDAPGS